MITTENQSQTWKNRRKYKPIDFIKVWMWFFFVDYLSTFIALNFLEGLQELNPISRSLFSLGAMGWFYAIIVSAAIMWCLAAVICFIVNRVRPSRAKAMYWFALLFYSVGNAIVIINNIRLIILYW